MSPDHADNRRQEVGRGPLSLLRAAGITGFFRPSQLAAAGLTRDQLPALVRSGSVERIDRGLYRLTDAELTEKYSLAMACTRVPNSVVCLLSALEVYGIGTQFAHGAWLAIPHKARVPRLNGLRLRIVRFSGAAWTHGVLETEFEGVPARITSPARTIVDCFRFERLLGAEATLEALLDALRTRIVTVAEVAQIESVLPSRRLRLALELQSVRSI